MKRLITIFITAASLFLAASVHAANVAPLGLEIGVATLDQVKTKLARSQLAPIGVNAYSDGPMLESDGDGLDIEGLSKIMFIFDSKNTLAGVIMTLADHRFDDVYQFLASKYQVKTQEIPFVGDRYVRLTQGNSLVEITDPHLSFEMEVRYLSNTLMAAYKSRSTENDKQQRKTQSGKF